MTPPTVEISKYFKLSVVAQLKENITHLVLLVCKIAMKRHNVLEYLGSELQENVFSFENVVFAADDANIAFGETLCRYYWKAGLNSHTA